MTTVAQQADLFIEGLSNRRRKAKPATIKSYGSYLRNWIVPVLGAYELGAIGNREAKVFVTHLVDQHLAAATVSGALTTLKLLVASELNENGDRLWHPDWNTDFIDAPPVDPKEQNAPVIAARELNAALRKASSHYALYYALQAGSGLRMGEMLALRRGLDDGIRSFLDLEKSIVFVRSTIYNRVEQSTKSESGTREVDLCSTLVKWLKEHPDVNRTETGSYLFQTGKQTLWHVANMYDRFKADGIPGSHSLRRFRTTHLENLSVPRVLVDYWTGHVGKAITDRYTKLGQSINARNNWCRRAGLGFQLPGEPEENVIYEEPLDMDEDTLEKEIEEGL